ncbi:hypothetical protein [Shouchella shacheensis]|uniref:hypothetical protein n=1 Tax=Shouchella shacheensis TaxID=1649580 RepID=UPI00073FF089|nr:hypothetical protein [Shouchella shacheensis]
MKVEGFYHVHLKAPYDEYFHLHADVEPDSTYMEVVLTAMALVAEHPDFPNKRRRKLVTFLTNESKLTLTYDNPEQYGVQFNVAIILCGHMEQLSEPQMLITVVEKFVHHFWDVDDEIETAKLVASIIPGIRANEEGGYVLGA